MRLINNNTGVSLTGKDQADVQSVCNMLQILAALGMAKSTLAGEVETTFKAATAVPAKENEVSQLQNELPLDNIDDAIPA